MDKPIISREELYGLISPVYPTLLSTPVALFGLRGFFDPPGENQRGIYDDCIGIWTPDTFEVFNANTDPSITRKGIAVLQDGVYKYQQGIHGRHHLNMKLASDITLMNTLVKTGKDLPAIPGRILPYWALTQAGPVTLLRDGATVAETVTDPAKYPMINIHRGGYNTTSSEGCQTIHPDFWTAFYWNLVKPKMSQYKVPIVEYGLLTKKA